MPGVQRAQCVHHPAMQLCTQAAPHYHWQPQVSLKAAGSSCSSARLCMGSKPGRHCRHGTPHTSMIIMLFHCAPAVAGHGPSRHDGRVMCHPGGSPGRARRPLGPGVCSLQHSTSGAHSHTHHITASCHHPGGRSKACKAAHQQGPLPSWSELAPQHHLPLAPHSQGTVHAHSSAALRAGTVSWLPMAACLAVLYSVRAAV
jgi:hypothetical protein